MIFEMKQQLSLGVQLFSANFSYRRKEWESFDRSKWRGSLIKSRGVLLAVALLAAATILVKWTNTASADVGLITKWGGQGAANGLFNGPFGVAVDSSGNVYVSDSGNNRIQKFNSSGTFISQWGTFGGANGNFNNPIGVAVDGESNVYVADVNNNRIQKFSSSGAFIFKFGIPGSGDGHFNSPYGVALDLSGNIYVADSSNHRIQKFDSSGSFIASWGTHGGGNGQFDNPRGLAVDHSGNVYVADVGNSRIQKFDSSGNYVTQWGASGSGSGQFQFVAGVVADAWGYVYVTDAGNHNVQKFTSAGAFVTKWGTNGTGDGQFNAPFGLAVDSLGNVYVADSNNNRIQKFGCAAPEEYFTLKFGQPGTFNLPQGVAVDSAGNLYVADTDNSRIQKYTSSGAFITQWGTFGSGNGQFESPFGIAIDTSGTLYVSEIFSPRIQKFTSAGVYISQFPTGGTFSRGIAVDKAGNVYVADEGTNSVRKFNSSGTLVTEWGGGPQTLGIDGLFYTPQGVAVDPWGYVYVTDLGNNRVQKFDSSGNFISKFGSLGTGDGQFWNPRGLGIDAAGNIYVADTLRHRVQKLTNSGTFVIKWGDHGSHDSEFQDPFGITVDQSGNIYVVDTDNVRIQKFSQGAPVARAGPDQTFTCVKTPTQTVTLDATSTTDPTPGDAATLEYEWGEGTSLLGSGATITVPFTPGTHTITLAVTDDCDHSSTDTVVITVSAYNHATCNTAPSAIDDAASFNEDSGAQTIKVLGNDTDYDNDALSVTSVTQGAHGSVALIGGGIQLSYTPASDYSGSDSFTYSISDSHGGTATGTVNVTVDAVNDLPSFTKGANQTVDEDSGSQLIAGWATNILSGPPNESDQALDFIVSNNNNALFSAQPAVAANGSLSYTPASDANGTATVSVQLHDNGAGQDTSAAQTFTITVNAVNDPPSFTRGADQIISENAGPQSVTAWATNISQGPGESGQTPLIFNVNVGSTIGNLSFVTQPSIDATTGTLTYEVLHGTNGTANLSVTLNDSGPGAPPNSNTSAAQTFSIAIGAVNDAPVNTVPASVNMPQDTVYTFAGSAISVADVDAGETDNVISVALNATNGTMNLGGTTGLTFTGGSNGSAAMTFEGTIPNLKAALNNTMFTATAGYTGAASIQMVSNDLGKTGAGGVMSDTDTINISINAPTAMYINEVLFNPPGTDAPNEYVELRGPANTTIPAGTYLVAIAGDAADNPGDVQTIINLAGLSFGSNGFLVLLQNGNTYTIDPGPTVLVSTTTGFGGLPATFQADGGATDIEDASVTFMLIQAAVPPSLTDDIDVNDDGATDGSVFAGWNVRDSISGMNGSANARAYGALSFRNSAGSGTAVGGEVIVNFIPSYVGRIGDSTGPTAADWAASGVLEGAAPHWTLGLAAETAPASFGGKALNHIGASNFANAAPLNSVPIATQNINEDFTLTFNSGNANLISISDPDAGGADVKATLTATNGTISLNGTAGLTFTPAGADNDGLKDTQIIFTGTIANINTALNGMTFTPTLNYFGAASIQIVTDDQGNAGVGGAQTDTDTVSINVDAINDPPSFSISGNPSAVDEDSGLHAINGFAFSISQGPGESGQTLTFNLSPAGTIGNISFASGPAIDATTGNLIFMTNPDTNGTATFNVTLSDSGSNAAPNSNVSGTQQITITVNAVNDAPSFQIPNNPPSVNEDTGAQIVNGFATNFQGGPATATDETTQTLVSYTVAQTGTTGSLRFTSGPSIDNTGALSYAPTGDTSGTASFKVVATDSGSGSAPNLNQSAPVTFTITVTAQNDAPVMDNTGDMSLNAINEDVNDASNPGTLVTDMIASAGGDRITDADAGALEGIAVIAVNNTNGAWQYSIDNGTNWLPFGTPDSSTARLLAADATARVRFIPNPNFNGTVDPGLTFRAWDQTSGANGNTADTFVTGNTTAFSTATETASVTINPVNDNPTKTGIPPVTVNEDAPNTVLDLRASFSDVEDGNDLAYTIQANTNPSLFGSVSISNANDNLTLAYAANAFGSAQITIRGTDVGGLFVESTFTVTVNSANDPPTFTKGPDQTTSQNSGLQTVTNWAKNMSPGPADEVGQTLSFNVTGNTNAALFSTAPAIDSITGTLTYTGANNASGNATITITLSDNGGTANGGNPTSAPQTFVITITPCVNPATVTNTNDSGAGSLREAITNVCAGGTVNFDPALNGQTISLTSAELVIDKNMTIAGPGANFLTVMRSAAGGTPQFRIFKNLPGITVSISGLTINNGSSALDGGGVFNQGALTLAASSVTGNTTPFQGGGLSNAAGGMMTITGSTISANTGPLGGGIVNAGTLTLINSTVTGNTGDGLSNANGANANLTNDTFANNSIRGITSNPGATTNVRNTIVANTPGAVGDVSGDFVSQGNNLFGKGEGSTGLANGVKNDKVGTTAAPLDVLLSVLGNYGGPTQTHALLPGSPAIEAANNCVMDAAHCGDANIPQLTTDQRGGPFNRLVNPTVDSGAFESRGFTITTSSGDLQTAVFNTAFGEPLLATISSVAGEPVSGGQVVFTAPGSGASATFTGGHTTVSSVIDAGGEATASPTANATVGGPYKVSATSNGVTGRSDFSLTNIKANQTINFGALANKTFGNSDFVVGATATSGLPVSLAASGQCTVTSPSSGSVRITAAGFCTITASQAGDANYNPATNVPQSFNIAKAAIPTAVTSSVNPSDFVQIVTFTATLTSDAGTPSSMVQFKDGGANLGAPATLNASGVAQLTTSSLATGNHNITAEYSGDTNFLPNTGTLAGGQVVKGQLSLSIDDVSITEGHTGTKVLNFTVTLSAASSLTVTANFATADDTATAPADYVATNGPLTFNPGETTRTISVTVNGDTSFEPDETFIVTLSNASNATITKATGTGAIKNDDAQGGFIGFSSASISVNEIDGNVTVTVVRSNDVTQAATVDYATDDTGSSSNCDALNTGLASQRCDYTFMFGTLRFAANETQKTIDIPLNLDGYTEGPETFTVKLTNPGGGASLVAPSTAAITINDSTPPLPNPLDDTASFVRQQYHDFLNRDADPAGLAFWTDNIDKCTDVARLPRGQTILECIEIQRLNTSAAFFLSIEFQQSGNFVRSFYVAALDRPLTNNMEAFIEFERDTQAVQRGVTVGQANWQQTLDNNRDGFMKDFVTRAEFVGLYPTTDTPTQYVDRLYQHAGITPPADERNDAIAEFGTVSTAADAGARGRALLRITQNPGFQAREMNRSFVQMEYFGYLRRNPNDAPDANFAGFDFWLNKLNGANGNYISSEMVKAFISSTEYRRRFGP